MDIYNLSGFKWWCKQRRNSSFLAIVFVAFFTFILGSSLISNLKANTSADKSGIAMLAFMLVFFGIMLLSILRTVIRNMNIKVEEYWVGIITDFYIKRTGSSNRRKSRSYIVANVNGKEMVARCMQETYRQAQHGQQIVMFTVKGDKRLYCVHPEM